MIEEKNCSDMNNSGNDTVPEKNDFTENTGFSGIHAAGVMPDMNGTMGINTYPAYNVRKKEKPVYGKAECVVSALVFLLSVLYVRYALFYITGIITSAVYIAIITTVIIYLKKKNFVFSGINKMLATALYLFSTVFAFTDNRDIKGLCHMFLFGAGAYFVFAVCAGREDVDRYLPYAVRKSMFDYPFTEFSSQGDILSDAMKSSSTSSNIRRIIIGLVLTVPVTGIVGSLLMSADDNMDRMLTGLFDGLVSGEFLTWIMQICIAIPCSLYLFGMLYSNVYRKKITELTDVECDGKLRSKRKVSNLVFYSAATPVLILYVMFFISQASYFLSAFMGELPEEFSYAEYARHGFFELCWIVGINLCIMIIMNLHSRESGEEKTTALKVYNIIFCIFTLILIATVMSKMIMYIDTYGLTVLRVYTTWFMVLCAFIFLLILVKQFRPQMNMAKIISIGFTLMFAVLCFSRTEAVIVKYNCAMNKVTADNVKESEIMDMSDDGLLAAVNAGLITAEEARSESSYDHCYHSTDWMNISTILIKSKASGN